MQPELVRAQRMSNLGLLRARRQRPEDAVASMGAVQSQDHLPAKWSLAQRCAGVDERDVEAAYARGAILRTHVLRPTWHYVTPADIGWLLELTGPRVERGAARVLRSFGLDDDTLRRCRTVAVKALRRGHVTRAELGEALAAAGIETDARRLAYIAMHLELRRVVCSGEPRGKTHTYALFEERAPGAMSLERDEALAELVRRYFTSHGPATVKDLVWWSGLTAADVRRGVEIVGDELARSEDDGRVYLFAPGRSRASIRSPRVHLLQAYDEYLVAYRETKALTDPLRIWAERDGTSFLACVTIDGMIAGRWRAVRKPDHVVIEIDPARRFDAAESEALEQQARRYARFLSQSNVTISISTRRRSPAQGS